MLLSCWSVVLSLRESTKEHVLSRRSWETLLSTRGSHRCPRAPGRRRQTPSSGVIINRTFFNFIFGSVPFCMMSYDGHAIYDHYEQKERTGKREGDPSKSLQHLHLPCYPDSDTRGRLCICSWKHHVARMLGCFFFLSRNFSLHILWLYCTARHYNDNGKLNSSESIVTNNWSKIV